MPLKDFKLILCDLGNVLIQFDHRIAVRKILPYSDKTFDEIYSIFFDSSLTKDFEEGKISPEDFFYSLREVLNFKNLTFDEFIPIWNEIFFDNEGMLELLQSLQSKYHLHLISNINVLHYDYLVKVFADHFAIFDKIYLSCALGCRKPDPLIYHRAVEECGYSFEDTFYLDDRIDLVQEAQKLGLRSLVFKSVGDFKKELKRSGLL